MNFNVCLSVEPGIGGNRRSTFPNSVCSCLGAAQARGGLRDPTGENPLPPRDTPVSGTLRGLLSPCRGPALPGAGGIGEGGPAARRYRSPRVSGTHAGMLRLPCVRPPAAEAAPPSPHRCRRLGGICKCGGDVRRLRPQRAEIGPARPPPPTRPLSLLYSPAAPRPPPPRRDPTRRSAGECRGGAPRSGWPARGRRHRERGCVCVVWGGPLCAAPRFSVPSGALPSPAGAEGRAPAGAAPLPLSRRLRGLRSGLGEVGAADPLRPPAPRPRAGRGNRWVPAAGVGRRAGKGVAPRAWGAGGGDATRGGERGSLPSDAGGGVWCGAGSAVPPPPVPELRGGRRWGRAARPAAIASGAGASTPPPAAAGWRPGADGRPRRAPVGARCSPWGAGNGRPPRFGSPDLPFAVGSGVAIRFFFP